MECLRTPPYIHFPMPFQLRKRNGAHNRIRTDDLFLTKEVLYRLSYVSLDRDTSFLMDRQSMPSHCTHATQINPEQPNDRLHKYGVERVAGIEPASSAWKAEVLPLNHTRVPFFAFAYRPKPPRYTYHRNNLSAAAQKANGGGRRIRTFEGLAVRFTV